MMLGYLTDPFCIEKGGTMRMRLSKKLKIKIGTMAA